MRLFVSAKSGFGGFARFSRLRDLSELLEIAASKLGTRFEEIRSDEDLEEVRGRYSRQGEKAFAELHEELSPQVFGVTFRRANKKGWRNCRLCP